MRPAARPSCPRRSSAWWDSWTTPSGWRPSGSRRAGHRVALLGPDAVSLGGSEYLWARHGRLAGALAPLDLEIERRVQAAVRAAIGSGLVPRPHDCCRGWPRGRAGRGVRHRAASRSGCDGDAGGEGRARSGAVRRGPVARSWWRWSRRAQREFEALMAESAIPVAVDRDDGRRPAGAARWARRRSWTRGWSSSSTRGGTALNATWRDDKFHDECGLFGIWNHPEAANVTYLGLYALQHRGQESAGIAATDGTAFHTREGDGLGGRRLQPASGCAGCPAIAPSATCATRRRAARTCATPSRSPRRTARGPDRDRPQRQPDQRRRAAPGHGARRRDLPVELRHRGDPAPARAGPGGAARGADPDALAQVKGAYSLLFLTRDAIFAVRDPYGFRPLSLGRLGDAWVVASETCALDLIEAEHERDVEPGEMRGHQRRRAAVVPRPLPPASGCSASSSTSTSRAPTRSCGAATCTRCARRSAASWRASIRSRPTSSSRCPTRATSAALGYSEEVGHALRAGAHPQPLRRAAPSSSPSRGSATSA